MQNTQEIYNQLFKPEHTAPEDIGLLIALNLLGPYCAPFIMLGGLGFLAKATYHLLRNEGDLKTSAFNTAKEMLFWAGICYFGVSISIACAIIKIVSTVLKTAGESINPPLQARISP